jgi:hypothetical protein
MVGFKASCSCFTVPSIPTEVPPHGSSDLSIVTNGTSRNSQQLHRTVQFYVHDGSRLFNIDLIVHANEFQVATAEMP